MIQKKGISGFSLAEVAITAFLIAGAILVIAQLFQKSAVIMHKSDLMTTAASLAEDISSKIKDQPFDSVFSFDSDNMHPTRAVFGMSAFCPEPYLVDVNATSMGPVLLSALENVRNQGFDGFKVIITYLRRDSSAQVSILTDGYTPWVAGSIRSTTRTDNYVCDAVDPQVCFRDRNSDGDYWDLVGGIPETPDTGLKMVTVQIIKRGEPVGVKRGTILSERGLFGKENSSEQSPLKLRVTRPLNGVWAFNAASRSRRTSLERATRRTYPSYWFDIDDPNHISCRIDDSVANDITVNKLIDVSGADVAGSGFLLPGSAATLVMKGFTDLGQSGMLEVSDMLNSSSHPSQVDDTVLFTPTSVFSIVGELNTISGPNFLMRDGLHRLWTRKRATTAGGAPLPVSSPYDVRIIKVDDGIPQKISFMERGEGPRQKVGIIISDYFQTDGVTPSNYSGLAFEPTSVVVKDNTTGVSSHTWVGSWVEPGRYLWRNWDVMVMSNKNPPYRTYGATTTLRLRDQEGYPWKFEIGHNYSVTWEWGDKAGYKDTATETFTPTIPADTVPPEVFFDSRLPPGSAIRLDGNWNGHYMDVNYPFWSVSFRDTRSGIDYERTKIELCPENHPTPAVEGAPTPGCFTIFSKAEDVRPNRYIAWGDWFMYGGGLRGPSYDSLEVWIRVPSTGVLGPLTIIPMAHYDLRCIIYDNAGNRFDYTNPYTPKLYFYVP